MCDWHWCCWVQLSYCFKNKDIYIKVQSVQFNCFNQWCSVPSLSYNPYLYRGLFKTSFRHIFVFATHYGDVKMGTVAFQITSLTIVYSTVWSDADERKHQSSVLQAFVRGIHRWPVNSPHRWPVTRKMLPFDDVIMTLITAIYFVTVCHHERAIAIPEIHPNIQYSSCSINPFLHMFFSPWSRYFEIFIGDALIPLCSGQIRNNRTTKIWMLWTKKRLWRLSYNKERCGIGLGEYIFT